jgi:hypothetical protein
LLGQGIAVTIVFSYRKDNVWFGATIINDRRSNGKGGDTLFVQNGLWRYDGSIFTQVAQRVLLL